MHRTKTICIFLTAMSTLLGNISMAFSQKIAEPFEFQFEGKTLSGLIEKPQDQAPQALVILIPGYGKTNFVEGNWYTELRKTLVEAGLTVCMWDKMGCGQSEGEFNAQQPVDNSAEEALAAIQELKRLNVPGSEKIGLWGISRAGWICPLIIERYPIDFWISVSGTDDKENFGYLVKSNLRIHGKSEAEVERLYQAWRLGHKLYCTTNNYPRFLEAIQPLQEDSLCRKLFGYTKPTPITRQDKQEYKRNGSCIPGGDILIPKVGCGHIWIILTNYWGQVDCPVLALFGENDAQVDWRKTKALYEHTLGSKPDADLTVQVFEQCNHNLKRCITCAYQEDLSALNWQACEGYYETMVEWLREKGMVK